MKNKYKVVLKRAGEDVVYYTYSDSIYKVEKAAKTFALISNTVFLYVALCCSN